MDIDAEKKQLNDEGYIHIYEWEDAPGTVYPPHTHQGAVALYIRSGEITFQFGEKTTLVRAGNRFDVPPRTEHTARVGHEGCGYLVGEMIEGDS